LDSGHVIAGLNPEKEHKSSARTLRSGSQCRRV